MNRTRAPRPTAPIAASRVAAVPAACETAINSPRSGGSRRTSKESLAITRQLGAAPSRIVWIARAACSLVPHPQIKIVSPANAASPTRSARRLRAGSAEIWAGKPSSAWIISSITHGGPLRSSGSRSLISPPSSLVQRSEPPSCGCAAGDRHGINRCPYCPSCRYCPSRCHPRLGSGPGARCPRLYCPRSGRR